MGTPFILRGYSLTLAFLMFLITNSVGQLPGYNLSAPREVMVQRGLCVHIPCSFTVPDDVTLSINAKGFWYRIETSSAVLVAANDGSVVSLTTRGRFFLTGSVWRRDCSLSINDARRIDEARYHFRLEDSVNFSYTRLFPSVKVTELTDLPEIFENRLVAGDKVTLTCKSPGRCSGFSPVITWQGVEGLFQMYRYDFADGNRSYFSNVTFTPSEKDNGSPVICIVNFQTSSIITKKQIILNVKYPPSISITIEGLVTNKSIPYIVKEGDTKIMNCLVDSNPTSLVTWSVGGQVKDDPVYTTVLAYKLTDIGVHHAGRYWCMAKNEYGIKNSSIEIIVHYPPSVNITIEGLVPNESNPFIVKEGDSKIIKCVVDSNPTSLITWSMGGQIKNGPINASLLAYDLTDIGVDHAGRYYCSANNEYGITNSSIEIIVHYKPQIVAGENSTCWETKNHIECTCKIHSLPQANLTWKIDNKMYPSFYNDTILKISTGKVKAVTNSSLTVKVGQTNIKIIQCLSFNKHGELNLLLLNKPSAAQPLSNTMAIGAACGVISLALLLITCFLLLKYFRKKALEPKSEDKTEISNHDCNVIYSNTELYCHGAHSSEQPPEMDPGEEEGSLYMNCADIHYASIDFSKMKTKPVKEEDEIEYAEIRHNK